MRGDGGKTSSLLYPRGGCPRNRYIRRTKCGRSLSLLQTEAPPFRHSHHLNFVLRGFPIFWFFAADKQTKTKTAFPTGEKSTTAASPRVRLSAVGRWTAKCSCALQPRRVLCPLCRPDRVCAIVFFSTREFVQRELTQKEHRPFESLLLPPNTTKSVFRNRTICEHTDGG